MKKNSLIIFAGILVVVAGGWLGVNQLLKMRTAAPSSEEDLTTGAIEKAPTAAEKTSETSKVVLDETETSSGETFKAVSGEIISISDRTLLLEVEGDRLQVEVAIDAKIARTVLPTGSGTPQVTEIGIEELQIGERVDALVKIEGGKATATNLNVIVEP